MSWKVMGGSGETKTVDEFAEAMGLPRVKEFGLPKREWKLLTGKEIATAAAEMLNTLLLTRWNLRIGYAPREAWEDGMEYHWLRSDPVLFGDQYLTLTIEEFMGEPVKARIEVLAGRIAASAHENGASCVVFTDLEIPRMLDMAECGSGGFVRTRIVRSYNIEENTKPAYFDVLCGFRRQ